MNRIALSAAVASFAAAAWATSADAAFVYDIPFGGLTGSQGIGTPVSAGDGVAMTGLILNQPGALSNAIEFTAGAGGKGVNVSAAWFVKNTFRLVGVNIDLLDSSNNVIASDTFQGLLGGVAVSTLNFAGLTAGETYSLMITGDVITNGNYDIKLEVTPVPAAVLLLGPALLGLGLAARRAA